MKGLLRNNLYAVLSNLKDFSAILFLFCITAIVLGRVQLFITGFMILSMVGFPICFIISLRKESAGNWNKYKLTLPVKRSEVVKSHLITHVMFLLIGVLLACIGLALVISLRGIPFDRKIDILMIFTLGIGISLFLGAFFFPLYFLLGEDRNEIILGGSLLCSVLLFAGIILYINTLFGPHMTTTQMVTGSGILLGFGVFMFCISFPAAVSAYKIKEY